MGLCVFLATAVSGITCTQQEALAAGPQFDAPFQVAQKVNADAWAAEDLQIDEKLGALRERFGKRPNIIWK